VTFLFYFAFVHMDGHVSVHMLSCSVHLDIVQKFFFIFNLLSMKIYVNTSKLYGQLCFSSRLNIGKKKERYDAQRW
jgi:hypothetical protein